MKRYPNTEAITRALRAQTTPAARLAAWQAKSIHTRARLIRDYLEKPYHKGETRATARRKLIAAEGPELSSPEAERPLLWIPGNEISQEHGTGWYTDEFCEDTVRAIAVTLPDFPGMIFGGITYSNGMIFGGITYSDGAGQVFLDCHDYAAPGEDMQDITMSMLGRMDREAEIIAEKERDYQARWRAHQDAQEEHDEARDTLQSIRAALRPLIQELRQLRGHPDANAFPAAKSAICARLATLFSERAEALEIFNREIPADPEAA